MSRINELLESSDPLYNSSRTIPLPPLPSDDTGSSPLYQLIQRQNNYPPILKNQSWTRSAPYKEQREHRTSVESIANNYTHPSSDLKIRTITSQSYTSTQAARTGCLPHPALPGFHEKQMLIAAQSVAKSASKRKRTGNGVHKKETKPKKSYSSSPEQEEGYSRPMSPSEQISL